MMVRSPSRAKPGTSVSIVVLMLHVDPITGSGVDVHVIGTDSSPSWTVAGSLAVEPLAKSVMRMAVVSTTWPV